MEGFIDVPPMPMPFGGNDAAKTPIKDLGSGITAEMCVPVAAGGKGISRHFLNGLGYAATLGSFLDRCGYPYGEDVNSRPPDGYPKGAVIHYVDFSKKLVRSYMSLVDNNTETPDTTQTTTDETAVNNWKPLFPLKDYSFFPDYGARTLVTKTMLESTGQRKSIEIPVSESGWYCIKRTIEDYSNAQSDIDVHIAILGGGSPTLSWETLCTIPAYEGETATRILPFASNFRLYINYGKVTIQVYRFGWETVESPPQS